MCYLDNIWLGRWNIFINKLGHELDEYFDAAIDIDTSTIFLTFGDPNI